MIRNIRELWLRIFTRSSKLVSNDVKYYKIFGDDDEHHGYQYHDGFNVDMNKFDSDDTNSCTAGGLYYSNAKNICEFLGYGNYIREVVPVGKIVHPQSIYNYFSTYFSDDFSDDFSNDEDLFIKRYENKWRTKSLYLYDRHDLREVATWEWMELEGIDIMHEKALMWACSLGHLDVLQYLHSKGHTMTDVILRDIIKRTNHTHIVDYILHDMKFELESKISPRQVYPDMRIYLNSIDFEWQLNQNAAYESIRPIEVEFEVNDAPVIVDVPPEDVPPEDVPPTKPKKKKRKNIRL